MKRRTLRPNNQPGKSPNNKPNGGKAPRKQRSGRRHQGRHHRKPPPPAYIQRDLVLIPVSEGTGGIEEVRLKFDPLAKKIQAHVTLLFPEPAHVIEKEFLKKISHADLPPLANLTFSSIVVKDEMYLWLLPDHDSALKLKAWQTALMGQLSGHSQEEEFTPHITLGYVPRSVGENEAITFAKNLISLPLTLGFTKILLEEFTENQISTSVDALQLSL